MYEARACNFDAKLTTAEREGLSVGADVFYGSNVDAMILRDAQVVWMTVITSWRGIAIKTVQRGEVTNVAKGTK